MARLSDEARQKLAGQRQTRTSLWVDMKTIRKEYVRFLPFGQSGEPGVFGFRVTKIWSKHLKKNTTSPRTFGLKDPVLDWCDAQWKQAKDKRPDKERAAAIRSIANEDTKMECLGVIRGDLGTVESPKIRIFGFYPETYAAATLPGVEDGEDVTHSRSGKYCVLRRVKVGEKLKTTISDWRPEEPITKNKKLRMAIMAAGKALDVLNLQSAPDWSLLAKIYKLLTGKGIPEEYLKQKGVKAALAKAKKKREDESEDDETEEEEDGKALATDDEDEDETEEEDESEEDAEDSEDEESDDDETKDDDSEDDDESEDDEESEDEDDSEEEDSDEAEDDEDESEETDDAEDDAEDDDESEDDDDEAEEDDDESEDDESEEEDEEKPAGKKDKNKKPKVGDKVAFEADVKGKPKVIVGEIVKVGKDSDGDPLYSVKATDGVKWEKIGPDALVPVPKGKKDGAPKGEKTSDAIRRRAAKARGK